MARLTNKEKAISMLKQGFGHISLKAVEDEYGQVFNEDGTRYTEDTVYFETDGGFQGDTGNFLWLYGKEDDCQEEISCGILLDKCKVRSGVITSLGFS